MKKTRSVEDYLNADGPWRAELRRLREIVTGCGLEETVKWGGPCYTLAGQNVVGLGAFKSYFGLWFFQGALLDDPDGVLVNAQEGKTRAMRQWRMTDAGDIRPAAIRRYVKAAAALAREGRKVAPVRRRLQVPQELADALTRRDAGAAFERLRPGQQREYAEHVASAKRAETKLRRIDKILPMILAGTGLNDRYRRGKG